MLTAVQMPKVVGMAAAVSAATLLSGPRSPVEGQGGASLSGIVVEEGSDRPLSGVTIVILETRSSAVTGDDGTFSFRDVAPGNVVLRAALGGFTSVVESLEVSAEEVGFLQVALVPLAAALDELLVVGDANRAGYNEASLRNDDGDLGTAADLLEGRIPGLSLRQLGGSAAGGARVRVRGSNSLFLTGEPAIYVDGIRVSSRTESLDSRSSADRHPLELIPASSVARIRVLRGPAAGARYPEASNGVILIETRQGRSRDDAGN